MALPTGCDLAIRIDLAALFGTAALAQHVSELKAELANHTQSDKKEVPNIATFLRQAGIDPIRHLDQVDVCVVSGEQSEGKSAAAARVAAKHAGYALVVRGRLQPGRVIATVLAQAPPRTF